MDKDLALAILFANVKTHRKKDFRKTAEAVRYLREFERMSYADIGRAVGADGWTISQFDKLYDLPESVWKQIESGNIMLDKGYRISRRGSEIQAELGDALSDLNTEDARAVVEYVVKNPDLSIDECKRKVLESKTVKDKIFMVVVPLPEETYAKLKQDSRKRNISVDDMVRQIVVEWLLKVN